MSAVLKSVETTALAPVERAAAALGSTAREAALRELLAESKELVVITNAAGRDQVHAARMKLVRTRTGLVAAGADAIEDAKLFTTATRAEVARLVAITTPEEKRLEWMQTEWETEQAAIKQARADAERKRVSDIMARIDEIRGTPGMMTGKTAAQIAEAAEALAGMPVGEDFAEFMSQAQEARDAAMFVLGTLETAAADREAAAIAAAAEDARIKAERARLAAEDRERAAAREKEEAEHRATLAALQLQLADAARLVEENRQRKQAEADARQAAENDRLTAERLAEEKRQRDALPAVAVPAAAPAPARGILRKVVPVREYTNAQEPTPLTDAVFRATPTGGDVVVDMRDHASQLERDCMTMALRLYGEDSSTYSPECAEVMRRWGPRVDVLLQSPERVTARNEAANEWANSTGAKQ